MDVLNNPKYTYLLGKQRFYYKIWKTLFYYYSKMVFTFYTPLKVYGRENIPDSSFIFCSNHNSHMDVALLSAAAQKSFNHFGMMAAKDYWFDNWTRRTLINTVMNLIPIDRKINGVTQFPIKDTIKLCQAFMSYQQRSLIFFPEGTRGTPGKILPFKKGAARFSMNLGVPILPAVIFGSHKAWPRGKFLMRPTAIEVYILEPIYPETFLGNDIPSEDDLSNASKKMISELEQAITKKAMELYDK
ncbi:MAG: 1-acyl-sn-glycerol-3-phosphate acyltransferase [Candidatus Marinimicrobia bacterium]|jgi:1-acyl-sn-glycerol-3-phosphate acyltransferase|nr:1-acyl-sn-glycerol-3-phosphate acyltransferase [Candidatus Neomarinimicrobiota bacterium]MBT3631134.1 1-acyl-sn-glycerol-3-phosphate acyltransferase [Candidatus Neomarinimicrobiota bacterium]MBT3823500.1 1-acyl-sn-glycerol-3-phosphate acyltransferase [Candidatus Neomarinimicrobiota bacterium]MBT4130394.1 1-acyl-sn-glycerol-3-phosphate acyltransferase [Candidatus Neomarinimicrobiota bacterium]MBT4295108.1 1-acyl-sn-glycerol-3-phosphate acyltransferase [Candidatus Neomarinimicrobiota bacterium